MNTAIVEWLIVNRDVRVHVLAEEGIVVGKAHRDELEMRLEIRTD